MSDRVVIFIDYQNVYRAARAVFHDHTFDPHWFGQINPLKLGLRLAADSPFDRELQEVRVYRGLPSSRRDSKGYGAARRQIDYWESLDRVTVHDRPLRYPKGWPDDTLPGEKPQEKGIDVELAIDMAVMAFREEYDVGVLFSLDTDLKPALEVVHALGRSNGGPPRSEVAAWSREGMKNSRLGLKGERIYCHWIGRDIYESVRDDTDYGKPPRR